MAIIHALIAGSAGTSTPPTDLDYPIPGSGAYRSGAVALNAVSYANKGTPYDPGGAVGTVPNENSSGLRRYKYDGNFCSGALDTVSSYNLSFFNTATFFKAVDDPTVSWGSQSDGDNPGQHNFSIEWLGYMFAPATQNYNIYVESDDTCAVWIGSAAISGFNASNCSVSSSNKSLPGNAATSVNTNSVSLTANYWYPVRIWFSEFTGGCKFQLYLQGADGTKKQGSSINWAYNDNTGGF